MHITNSAIKQISHYKYGFNHNFNDQKKYFKRTAMRTEDIYSISTTILEDII